MRPCRIHIAEADEAVRDELEAALLQQGFQVTASPSGYPVAEMMDDWPDMFVIDLELPDVNGIELCKWLKSHHYSKHIPVILLCGDLYLKVLAASAPADNYIRKPVDTSDLLVKVTDCLQSISADYDKV